MRIKKTFSLIICSVLILGILMPGGIIPDLSGIRAEATSGGFCGFHLIYSLSENGVLTISGTGEMYDYWYGNIQKDKRGVASATLFYNTAGKEIPYQGKIHRSGSEMEQRESA